jgi:hypothetical protein
VCTAPDRVQTFQPDPVLTERYGYGIERMRKPTARLFVTRQLGRYEPLGHAPNPYFEIELIPGHLGDFLPALRGQSEKLNDVAIGSSDLPGCSDDATELVITEHTISRDLAGGLLDTLTRRAIDDRPAYAPREEGLCSGAA